MQAVQLLIVRYLSGIVVIKCVVDAYATSQI